MDTLRRRITALLALTTLAAAPLVGTVSAAAAAPASSVH